MCIHGIKNGDLGSEVFMQTMTDFLIILEPASYPVQNIILNQDSTYKPKLTHDIYGETFNIEIEDDTIFLTHDLFSLVGHGPDLFSAELSLIERAKLFVDMYIYDDDSTLTEEAILFKEWLLKVVDKLY